ncbi:hypothetical protein Bbelb_118760 [Branchiostoma belcheri]|nr:hypothetical protein Bbelb_118760 [Branchiostoma belcheri]
MAGSSPERSHLEDRNRRFGAILGLTPSDVGTKLLGDEKFCPGATRNSALERGEILLRNGWINKLDEFQETLSFNSVDIAVVSETWQSSSHPESAIAVSGFNVFSTHRSDRRGGGVAVYVKQQIASRQLTEYAVPEGLECVWVWTRPRRLARPMSSIVVCGVYLPPSSPNGDILVDHLLSVSDNVRTKYPDCGIALLGDFNRLDTSELCRGSLLSQVVKNKTRGNAILDLIVTNMKDVYQCPSILPPIGLSDHSSVLWIPKGKRAPDKPTKKLTRPLCQASVHEFGRWVTSHNWSEVYNATGTAAKTNAFYGTLQDAITTFFPTKVIKTHSSDKPWVTPQIKRLITLRQKAFNKQTCPVWKFYRNATHRAIARAKKNYYTDRVATLKTDNPRQWHKEVMRMANSGKGNSEIKIPGLDSDNDATIADAINSKFAGISQALPALDLTSLPTFLPAPQELPTLQVWDVYKRLLAVKTSKAPGPDNFPPKLLREFACELSAPFCHILNASFAEGIVPAQWKEAVVVPIPKSQPPTLDQLRPISLTSQFSKIAEYFALKWILNDIEFDKRQFGSLKGRSTVHAIVSLIDSLCKATDKPSTSCSILATDFSKAFDRVHHSTVITKLIYKGLRPELLPWICDFITRRRQVVRYRGALSGWEYLSCGVAQGTLLGPVLFLVLIDDACHDANSPVWKYVDDMNLLETRSLNQPSSLQNDLDDLNTWSKRNHMLLNSVLGVILQNNLHWDKQVNHMVGKASRKLYFLKRLKRFNVSHSDLTTIYTGYIRPILEYAAPAWTPALTKAQERSLERVQRRACCIILGTNYTGYDNALQHLGLSSLAERRELLCVKFARTLVSGEKLFADRLESCRGAVRNGCGAVGIVSWSGEKWVWNGEKWVWSGEKWLRSGWNSVVER